MSPWAFMAAFQEWESEKADERRWAASRALAIVRGFGGKDVTTSGLWHDMTGEDLPGGERDPSVEEDLDAIAELSRERARQEK